MTMLERLKEYLKSTPKEQLKKEWEEIENMGFSSPNAIEYLKTLNTIYSVELKEYGPPQKINCANSTKNMAPIFSESFFLRNLVS
jgi:hypothetical protein